MRRRGDLPFNWIFVLFAMFIVACGSTHFMGIWNVWYPDYWVSGAIKALTAAVSVPTGIALALPEGYVALVHPRSGLAARFGVCAAELERGTRARGDEAGVDQADERDEEPDADADRGLERGRHRGHQAGDRRFGESGCCGVCCC